MSHRVLVIEGASSWFRDQFSASFNFRFEWANWNTISQQSLNQRHADLIVFVAEPKYPGVNDFFRWLADHPLTMPTLALLPADDDLVHTAADAVDDFMIAPLRQSEAAESRIEASRCQIARKQQCCGTRAIDAATGADRTCRRTSGLCGSHPADSHRRTT